jgi:hypothetical protein
LIRTQLAEESGNDKVSVPTFKVGDEYITDSWVIAEWVSWVCPFLIGAVSFCVLRVGAYRVEQEGVKQAGL